MHAAALLILVVLVCGVIYCRLVPANTFVGFRRPGGGRVVFSRTGIEFQGPPDHYPEGAFDRIESYVSRLKAPSRKLKYVSIFTPAGDRGFGLDSRDGVIHACFTVEWRQAPQREAAIRAFFEALDIAPTEDYLAGNGDVPDATRILAYPVSGGPAEVGGLARRILQELCGVSPTEALDIGYSER